MDIPDSVWGALGAFAPCAALGFWVIRDLSQRLKDERAENKSLNASLIELSKSTVLVLTELKARMG